MKVKETGEPQKSGDTWFYMEDGEIKDTQSEDIVKFKPVAKEVNKITDEGGDVDSYLKEHIKTKEDMKAYSKAVSSLAKETRDEYESDIKRMADIYEKNYKDPELRSFIESLPKANNKQLLMV